MAAATAASTPILFATSTRISELNTLSVVGLPRDGQPVLRMLAIVLDVHAVLAVDDHAAAGRQEREDRIVRDREAAARVRDQQAFGARDRERRRRAGERFLAGLRGQQAARDQRREAFAQADLLVQLVDVVHAELDHRGVERVRRTLLRATAGIRPAPG